MSFGVGGGFRCVGFCGRLGSVGSRCGGVERGGGTGIDRRVNARSFLLSVRR